MDIASRLQHYAQWSKMTNAGSPTPNVWGDRVQAETILGTDVTTISCLAYQDSVDDEGSDNPSTAKQQWMVLLPVDGSEVKEGDVILSITNKQGVLVHRGGTVGSIIIYDHPLRGIECRLATLSPN